MSIASSIVEILSPQAAGASVADVRIGLGYTAVSLSEGGTGVALTFLPRDEHCCTLVEDLHPIAGTEAIDLLARLSSPDPIEAALGLACANALVNRPGSDYLPGDVLERIGIGPEDNVGMVGNFKPLAGPIRQAAASLTIFERVAIPQGEIRPASEARKRLSTCQIALITGTSIINHTIDELLDAARDCREVVILGASTPLLPEAFGQTAVSLLSGVVVEDAVGIMQAVSAGGGMRAFKHHVRKVNLQRRYADRHSDSNPSG
jgi:uncharacterized protein